MTSRSSRRGTPRTVGALIHVSEMRIMSSRRLLWIAAAGAFWLVLSVIALGYYSVRASREDMDREAVRMGALYGHTLPAAPRAGHGSAKRAAAVSAASAAAAAITTALALAAAVTRNLRDRHTVRTRGFEIIR